MHYIMCMYRRPCGVALDAVPNLMVEYINKGFFLLTWNLFKISTPSETIFVNIASDIFDTIRNKILADNKNIIYNC